MVPAINNNPAAQYQIQACVSCSESQKSEQARSENRAENKTSDPFAPQDTVSISENARNLFNDSNEGKRIGLSDTEALSREEQAEVQELKQRDAKVKAHEMAHIAAGGGVVQGGAHYEYQTGPDGKKYAVGGHVNIDTGEENSPEATVRKMQQIKKAALAPANPSGSDRAVAAKAARVEMQARAEMREEQAEESDNSLQNQEPGVQMDELVPENAAGNSGGVAVM